MKYSMSTRRDWRRPSYEELKQGRIRFNRRMLKDMIKIIECERGLSKGPLDADNFHTITLSSD